jgi:putative alpha-1,2-mannosidase
MYTSFLRSLIATAKLEGYAPCARSSNFNGPIQGGTFADNILADGFVKGVELNWTEAYAAMRKNAEAVPPNNFDPRAPDSSTQDGRGALPDWKNRGYISTSFSRSGSRAVDYSTNDFALYQVAKGLGLEADAEKYLSRSRNWKNHWNPEVESRGVKGFLMPKTPESEWVDMDVRRKGYWKGVFYEGNSWEYSMGAVHDMEALIELCGGNETFVERLEKLFEIDGNGRNIYGMLLSCAHMHPEPRVKPVRNLSRSWKRSLLRNTLPLFVYRSPGPLRFHQPEDCSRKVLYEGLRPTR